MRKITLSLAVFLLLAACTKEEEKILKDAMDNQETVQQTSSKTTEKPMDAKSSVTDDRGQIEDAMVLGVYHDYTSSGLPESVLKNGTTKVLFFHASWCPVCKRADDYIRTELLNGTFKGEALRSVYRVNFDSEATLKARYAVTYQHTFVRVDGEGKELARLENPTNNQLYEFIAQ